VVSMMGRHFGEESFLLHADLEMKVEA
jgi:hypothetical protein